MDKNRILQRAMLMLITPSLLSLSSITCARRRPTSPVGVRGSNAQTETHGIQAGGASSGVVSQTDELRTSPLPGLVRMPEDQSPEERHADGDFLVFRAKGHGVTPIRR